MWQKALKIKWQNTKRLLLCIVYKEEFWRVNGISHRVDGPAHISYYESGKIEQEKWYLNGKFHRVDGPAAILYYETGEIEREKWYLYGKESNHEEWLIANNLYKPYNTWTDEERVLWSLSWM